MSKKPELSKSKIAPKPLGLWVSLWLRMGAILGLLVASAFLIESVTQDRIDDGILITLAIAVLIVVVAVMVVLGVDRYRIKQARRQEAILRYRRQQAAKIERVQAAQEKERLRAQCDPQYYERKMKQLVSRMDSIELDDDRPSPYWEDPELEVRVTQPRPVSLLRLLIGRIYKAMSPQSHSVHQKETVR